VDDRRLDASAARDLAAIVLAGGAGRRLGGIDKPGLVVGGRSMAGTVVSAATHAGAASVIVVGPVRADLAAPGVSFTSEEPAGGGPLPALRAGLRLVAEPWVLLLAGDLPFLTWQVLGLIVAAARSAGGAVLGDDDGRPQWLASCWQTGELRAALDSYVGNSLHGVLSSLPYAEVTMATRDGAPPCWIDCDTPEDLAAIRSLTGDPG
jgi:molybdopterin-guanine dinucleotide biosynthesis protein A